jgi:hypothetical protein
LGVGSAVRELLANSLGAEPGRPKRLEPQPGSNSTESISK